MAFGFVGFQHFDSIKTVKGMWKRRDGADYRGTAGDKERSLSPKPSGKFLKKVVDNSDLVC